MNAKTKFKTVDEYIAAYPEDIRQHLEKIRKAIKEAAPQADEVISYNMPAFKLNGILVYFAAHKNHIGFYPANSSTIGEFKEELKKYQTSPGTVQFPFETGIPVNLVKKIVKQRVAENLKKAKAKKQPKV